MVAVTVLSPCWRIYFKHWPCLYCAVTFSWFECYGKMVDSGFTPQLLFIEQHKVCMDTTLVRNFSVLEIWPCETQPKQIIKKNENKKNVYLWFRLQQTNRLTPNVQKCRYFIFPWSFGKTWQNINKWCVIYHNIWVLLQTCEVLFN